VIELLTENALRMLTLALLLVGSAFFSGSETALFTLTRHQLAGFGSSANPLQRLVHRLMRHPESTLVTILLGNMTVNVLFFAMTSVFVYRTAEQLAGWQSTLLGLVPLVAIIFFGEVMPKIVAVSYPVLFANIIAGPLYAFDKAVWPIRWFLYRAFVQPGVRLLTPPSPPDEAVGPEELQELLAHSATDGHLAPGESLLLQEVIELGTIQVREVAVPRVDLIVFDMHGSRDALLDLARKTGVKRIPVYRDHPDEIIGVVRVRDVLLNEDTPLEELQRPAWFVPEIKPIDSLLKEFRESGRQSAIAVDEYGGVTGLITLEDVMEEIVGEIVEEDEVAPDRLVQRVDENTYLLSGRLSIRQWAQAFGQRPIISGVTTISGLIVTRLGRVAHVGDTVTARNLRFTVTRMRGHRILEVRLERLGEMPDAQAREHGAS
jgi:putative hemolysin